MKFRGTGAEAEKIEPQMAPMIDIVFQLLIFFMLTLKIIEPEGDFSINMPVGAPSPTTQQTIHIPKLKVVMRAGPDGSLASLRLGEQPFQIRPASDRTRIAQWIEAHPDESEAEAARRLGEEDAFASMNASIGQFIKDTEGVSGGKQKLEAEIQFDYHLDSRYLVKAVSACRGKLVEGPDGQERLQSYIENIKFAPPIRN